MKKESYEYRCQMAEMHDEFKKRLEDALAQEQYVEATWLCYAIFEQRTQRLIEKHIAKCPKQKRSSDAPPVSISTKILCIKKLSKIGYGAYSGFDRKLLTEIIIWCKERNRLVHSLLRVDTYRSYDKDFKALACEGELLVNCLYEEATKVRNWCYSNNQFGKFPEIKCKCTNRCILEEG